MNVFWLEQREADVPADDGWLAPEEVARLNTLRIPKRRAEWRLGRWTAKRALAACLALGEESETLAKIEIRPTLSGAPGAFLSGEPAGMTISLSHRAGRSICAVSAGQVSLGCDLELVEARSDAFVADYFTPAEQTSIARASNAERDLLVMLLWSAKECALKALQEGLRLDTRSVSVTHLGRAATGWSALSVRTETGQEFDGWWQVWDGFIYTLVSCPAPNPPVALCAGDALSFSPPRGRDAVPFTHRSAD